MMLWTTITGHLHSLIWHIGMESTGAREQPLTAQPAVDLHTFGFREKPMKVQPVFARCVCISSHIDAHTCVTEYIEQIRYFIKWFGKSCTFVLVFKINSSGRKWFKISGNSAKSGTDLTNTVSLEKSSLYLLLLGPVSFYGTLRSAQS